MIMSNYKTHAELEFKAADWMNPDGTYKDEMQQYICEQVLMLLSVFDAHGHSGSSAPYAVNLFSKLALFKPLTPLTGEDWEWCEVMDGTFQNRRDSRVFKQADRYNGQAYFIEGVVFYDILKDDNGEEFKSYYTCGDSHVTITFPYTPETIFKERPTE
jgi:hypothetical protein